MALSEETIWKRLGSVNTSQDSVQTASLWIMHYKDSAIDKVTKCWMDVYEKADEKLRIALIYVMNDVVQKVNKKERGEAVKMAFHPHVVNACGLANGSVKKPIMRVIDVFAERGIYPPHIIEEMRAALGASKRQSREQSESDDNFTEVDHTIVIRKIESYYQNEELTEKARNILERSNFNFKNKMQDRMKDRAEGTKILAEIDESKNKLFQFLNSVERHQNKCQRLVEFLKSAKSSLNLQLRDVTIVDDAYEKFSSGILETKNQLDTILNTNSLTEDTFNKDLNTPSSDPPKYIMNDEGSSDDMEMDEEDRPPSDNTSLILPKDYVAPVSASSSTSTLDPRLQRLLNQNKGKLNQCEQREIESVVNNNNKANLNSIANDPRQRSRVLNSQSNDQKPLDSKNHLSQAQSSSVAAASMKPMSVDTSNPSLITSSALYSPQSAGSVAGVSSVLSNSMPASPVVFSSQNPLQFSYPLGAPPPCFLPHPGLLPPPPDFSHPPPFMNINPMPPSQEVIPGSSSVNILSPPSVASAGPHFTPMNTAPLTLGTDQNAARSSGERTNHGYAGNAPHQTTTPLSAQKRKYGDNQFENKGTNDNWNNTDRRWGKRSSSFHAPGYNHGGNDRWKKGSGFMNQK